MRKMLSFPLALLTLIVLGQTVVHGQTTQQGQIPAHSQNPAKDSTHRPDTVHRPDSTHARSDSTPWALYHSIEKTLDSVMDNDQSSRRMIETIQKKYGMQSRQMDSLYEVMSIKDSIDLEKVTDILDKYGWLGIAEIGEKANLAIFLVIQHSDSLTQVTYLPKMRQAVKEGKAKPDDLALLEDRVLCEQGKPQIYGSQVKVLKTGKYVFFPIQDERNVNKRRAAVGLSPLEEYAHYYGIDYHLPK